MVRRLIVHEEFERPDAGLGRNNFPYRAYKGQYVDLNDKIKKLKRNDYLKTTIETENCEWAFVSRSLTHRYTDN